jgi:hypothetical protein
MRPKQILINAMKAVVMLALMLTILNCASAHPESNINQFTIYRNGTRVGSAKTYQYRLPEGDCYALQVNVEVWIIIKLKIEVNVVNVLQSNKLVRALWSKHVNGSEKRTITIERTPSGYATRVNSKNAPSFQGNVTLTGLLMYFLEPASFDSLYSENHLVFIPIQKKGTHIYRIVQPDGHHSTYHYKDGQLFKLESDSDFGLVTFQKT